MAKKKPSNKRYAAISRTASDVLSIAPENWTEQQAELVKALKATVLLIKTDYGGFNAVPEWQKAVATLTEAGVKN